jgi:CheY-like chemotaxis protein/anti-sigma regulatory factor (Ser/Thr protein kinase)
VKKILIAEDDRTTRLLLREVLKSSGYSVTVAANGAAALKKLREKPFDLLLTDLWMPRLDGLGLMAKIREEGITTRVVVLTSDETPEALLRAIREQASRYIRKPFDPKVLIAIVTDALAATFVSAPIEVLSARPNWVELLVPCSLDTARSIAEFIAHLEADLSLDTRHQVGQAFRELINNAVEWGGKLDPNQKVRISFIRGQKMLLYRIADPGTGFQFKALKHSALGNPPDAPWEYLKAREEKNLRPGGLGLMMVKHIADELLYNEAQNEVVFVKYFDS